MNRFDVHIELSPQEQKLNIIKVSGVKQNVVDAKIAISEKVKELEKTREDRELRSFELQINVDPEMHPKIIVSTKHALFHSYSKYLNYLVYSQGRRGAVINKIRANHDVQISFPKKEKTDEDQSLIKIQGYEKNANAAKDEILRIVGDYNQLIKENVPVDARVHSRIIGQRGRHVRQIMEDFKVDIKFPKDGEANMNYVTVIGKDEDVEACKDHLLNLEEEYLQDCNEQPKTSSNVTYENLFENVMKSSHNERKEGFVVQGAPWERAPNKDSQVDFPDFGLSSNTTKQNEPSLASAWNQNRQ